MACSSPLFFACDDSENNVEYLCHPFLLQNDIYCADTNPHGIVSLGVAENLLMAPDLLDFFARVFRDGFLESDLSYGDHLWGSRRLVGALAAFYNRYAFTLPRASQREERKEKEKLMSGRA